MKFYRRGRIISYSKNPVVWWYFILSTAHTITTWPIVLVGKDGRGPL